MKDEAYFLKRFERVEELGRKVLSSVCVGGFGHRYVEMTLFAKWKTECVTLLGSVMPNSAIYAGQDVEQFIESETDDPYFLGTVILDCSSDNAVKIMKPASGKRTRAWSETQFSNFQLANSGR